MAHVFTCPPLQSGKPAAALTCVKAFADAIHADVVKTVKDGDCFFDSLLLSHTIDIPVQGVAAQRQYLRDAVVDYLLDHISPNLMPATDIEVLYQSGMYACSAGDLVPAYAPLVFGIRLDLYDLRVGPTGHYEVVLYHYGTQGPIVRMLRSGEHFRLLQLQAVNPQAVNPQAVNPQAVNPQAVNGQMQHAFAAAKELANSVKKAQSENQAFAKKMAQMNLNELEAKKLAQMNLNEMVAKKLAQEDANAAYAASLQGGHKARRGTALHRRTLRTRRTPRARRTRHKPKTRRQ